jgi:aldos-2-ulose dehydratase/isomerase family protein/FG-GAP repeat protein
MPTLLVALLLAANFKEHLIATDLKGGYQVVAADLNHDGKPDLIALGTQMTELVWYENPNWERHVIASGLSGMINLAIQDDQIVLAYGFSMVYANSKGIIAVLKPNGDPRQPWTLTEIDRLPTSHRLRWANIDGSKVVINAPLIGANAVAPEYRDHVPLVYYKPGEWKRTPIASDNEGVQHGITVVEWDGKGRDSILTTSFSGIDLYRYAKNQWTRTEISKGNPDPWPKSGTSDVAVGHTGKQRFLAAIEPWHGNKVAVYTDHRGQWQREEIDDSLLDAHTILTADLNGNGLDQIVAGMRGKPYQVLIYSNEKGHWQRQILDTGTMAAAACTAVDLNADHRLDLACIGSATANLKWYENLAGR